MIYGGIGQQDKNGVVMWEWTIRDHLGRFTGSGWVKSQAKARKCLREAYEDLETDEEFTITEYTPS